MPVPKGMTLTSRLRVNAFGISIDGHGAGPDQDLANPMGVGGMALHQWVLGTKTFQNMHADFAASLIGDEVGREGVDDDFAARGFENLGAWIMGRNMSGPVRGPWPDDSWKGWWGKDVRLGGGVATIRQYLTAGLIDEIHLVISPVLLGRGEHLLAGIDTVSLGYKCTEHASTDHATHVVLTK